MVLFGCSGFFVRLLRFEGKIICYGVPDSGVHYNGTIAFFRAIDFRRAGPYGKDAAVRRCLDLWRAGKLNLKTMPTHHFPLDRIVEAIDLTLDHPEECLGVVIDVC